MNLRNRPGGGGQVAVLDLKPSSSKLVRLAIPTTADLETVELEVMPRLGAKAGRT